MGGDENQNLFKINAVKMSVIEEVNTEETLPGVLEFLDALIHESKCSSTVGFFFPGKSKGISR